jgi:3-phosphoshikimate 1-carboxyvinyltransferase
MAPPGPLLIPRLTGRVDRVWPVPGSKSITNRALVLAALAEGTSVLENALESDDTRHMRTALAALGVEVADGAPGQLIVRGGRSRLRAHQDPLFIGNSGTTVRFLAALAALVPGATTLVGDEHMAKRPIQDLVDGLRQLGVRVDCASGCPPLTIHGGALPGGTVTMRGDRSSQYFSALLLVGGLAGGEMTVRVEGELVSRPYVDMTRRMVADFGGSIDATADGFRVKRCGQYRSRSYRIEPDASAASYPFALAAAGGHRIAVPGLDATTLQGDYAFLDILRELGAEVDATDGRTVVSGRGFHRGPAAFDHGGGESVTTIAAIDVAMRDISDTVMTLAAIAPLCDGPVTIRDIANIRIKETDRLAATVAELRRLGQRVEHGDDWLRVEPSPLTPATVRCYRDHRMAMSFAILGAIAGGVTIEDPACTAKTYPGFWDDLAALYPRRPW